MIPRSEAEDHLRVIRSLMEKATIYRALSAPSALVGGLLSIGASVFLIWYERQNGQNVVTSNTFTIVWTIVFVLTAGISLALIRRDAQRRGEPFISIGFRSAMRAAFPAMAFAALQTLAGVLRGSVHDLVPWWIAFYGIALLAMGHFAPRSISILGWFFLGAGAVSVGGMLDYAIGSQPHFGSELPQLIDGPCLLMGFTFGLFHLVYAACTWSRRT
jgi:hypothetical protein